LNLGVSPRVVVEAVVTVDSPCVVAEAGGLGDVVVVEGTNTGDGLTGSTEGRVLWELNTDGRDLSGLKTGDGPFGPLENAVKGLLWKRLFGTVTGAGVGCLALPGTGAR
jgi:hypothetical protein